MSRPSGAREGEARAKRKDVHERALGLLAVRMRSRRELERRLTQAGFDPQEVHDELVRLEAVGLIDDQAFARTVVESRVGHRGEARKVVAMKLGQAGVAPSVVLEALDEVAGDEAERAEAVARARAGRLQGLEPQVAFQRLYGFLARRGYGPEVARGAARRALAVESVED
jgi:regulatory protein